MVANNIKIPEWNEYYPSLSSATKEQKKFYSLFTTSLNGRRKIEIDGNLSYIFVYLYDTIRKFVGSKKIEPLVNKFKIVSEFYGNYEEVSLYISYWLQDAYLFIYDFDNAWKYFKQGKYGKIEDIIEIRGNCTNPTIYGKDILQILRSNSGLTKFGKENIEQVTALVDIFLSDFHFENKINYTEYFLKKFNYGNLNTENFAELKSYYNKESEYEMWYNDYQSVQDSPRPYPRQYNHYLFSGVPLWNNPYFTREEIPYIVSCALHNRFKEIIREAENTIRAEKNLPKVGEGWISETELYHKIYTRFPDERVVHHGKPPWLGRQHLDIYFPDKNIGVEYQGSQHQKPVDFFGGEKAFKKQQKLDKKKQNLCKRHKCILIYAYENYDFNDIVAQITTALSN